MGNKSETLRGMWACPVCTFMNDETMGVSCDMCRTARPSTDAGSSPQALEDADLQAALEAALHGSTSTELCISTTYELALSSGVVVRQVGVLNQFHSQWGPLISEYETGSAICGYTSLAAATVLAGLPPSSLTLSNVQSVLRSSETLYPLVSQAMSFVHRSRSSYMSSHPASFPTPSSCSSYLKAWCANYEVSDYLATLPASLSQHILFVRFNQWPSLHSASHEERDRLHLESRFGGSVDANGVAAFSPSDSTVLVESFADRPQGDCATEGVAAHRRELLSSREATERRGGGASVLQTTPSTTSVGPSSPLLCRPSFVPAWRIAVLDLNGHFAVMARVRGGEGEGEGEEQLVVLNTMDSNVLAGTGGFTVGVAADMLMAADEARVEETTASGNEDKRTCIEEK